MKNIALIKKLADVYSRLTTFAQFSPQEEDDEEELFFPKESEQQQFEKIKNVHQEFLTLNENSDTNKIASLFGSFMKLFESLSDTFNPTIKHSIRPLKEEIISAYEKLLVEKVKNIRVKYLETEKETNQALKIFLAKKLEKSKLERSGKITPEILEEYKNLFNTLYEPINNNMKILMRLANELNIIFVDLNKIMLDKPSLKLIIAPMYREINALHDNIREMYEKTGARVESIQYEEEKEDEYKNLSAQELISELKKLEEEYLMISGNTNDTNIGESINDLDQIYNEILEILNKIQETKDKKIINFAKKIFSEISKTHREMSGEADVGTFATQTEEQKAKAEEAMKKVKRKSSEKAEQYRKESPRQRYKKYLEKFNELPAEEQKKIKERWRQSRENYFKSEKGKAALNLARKKYQSSEKGKAYQKKYKKELRKKMKDKKMQEFLDKYFKS